MFIITVGNPHSLTGRSYVTVNISASYPVISVNDVVTTFTFSHSLKDVTTFIELDDKSKDTIFSELEALGYVPYLENYQDAVMYMNNRLLQPMYLNDDANPIITIDFDGVIHVPTKPITDPLVIDGNLLKGIVSWLLQYQPIPKAFRDEDSIDTGFVGPQLVIVSPRVSTPGGSKAIQDYLTQHGLPEEYFIEGLIKITDCPPFARFHIGASSISFDGDLPVLAFVLGSDPWYFPPEKRQQIRSIEDAFNLQESLAKLDIDLETIKGDK